MDAMLQLVLLLAMLGDASGTDARAGNDEPACARDARGTVATVREVRGNAESIMTRGSPAPASVIVRGAATAASMALVAPAMTPPATPADPWLSEDKFRHAAASWAAMVFTFAAVRSMTDDNDVALGVALPVTAGFGVAKEVVDRRSGGPFSFRDLAADALGAGAAWLFLREVH